MSKNNLFKEIIELKRLYKKCKKPINLHEPFLDFKDQNYVKKSIKNLSVSTAGKETILFEKELKKFTKSKYILSTNSGTSGLHLALLSLNIQKDSEILMPSINYIASANCSLYSGFNPHFIDVKKNSLGIDIESLEKYLKKISKISKKKCINIKNKKTIAAIIVPHLFGHIYEIERLVKLAKKFYMFIIEDAAEAFGSYYKNKHAGTFGDIGVLSFNGNKLITTGGGGAVIFKKKENYLKALKLATINKTPHPFEYQYDKIGYNYRIPSLNAALGLSQLKKINSILKLKKKIYLKIHSFFHRSEVFKILSEPNYCKSNYWLITIVLKKNYTKFRDKFIKESNKNKIILRPVWRAIHKSAHLRKFSKMNLKNTKNLEKRIINLPSSPYLNKFLK